MTEQMHYATYGGRHRRRRRNRDLRRGKRPGSGDGESKAEPRGQQREKRGNKPSSLSPRGQDPPSADNNNNSKKRQVTLVKGLDTSTGRRSSVSTPTLGAALPSSPSPSPSRHSRSGRSRSPHSSPSPSSHMRSQSWNGRTKHYDKNKLKAFDATATASELSRQLSAFDLSRTKKSKTKSIRADGKTKFRINEWKDKMKKMPLGMPMMSSISCKKYSKRAQSQKLLNSSGSRDGSSRGGTLTTEEGSTTYLSDDFFSDGSPSERSRRYNSDDSSDGRCSWPSESEESSSYYSESDSLYSDGDGYSKEGRSHRSVGSYYSEEEGDYYSSDDSGDSSGYNSKNNGRRSRSHSRRNKACSTSLKANSQLRRSSKSRVSFHDKSDHKSEEEYSVISNSSSNRHRGNTSKQQNPSLEHLLQENESLQQSVNKLRTDFEAMMHQMNAVEDGDDHSQDNGHDDSNVHNDSIMTNDTSSHISHCLTKIEDIKFAALEKLEARAKLLVESEAEAKAILEASKEDQERNKLLKNSEVVAGEDVEGLIVEGEKTLNSYQECIADLLNENERLYEKIVTLSKEKEEILQEVHELRSSGNNNGQRQQLERPCRLQLADEKVANSHSKCINDIAKLIHNQIDNGDVVAEDDDKEKQEQKQKETAPTTKIDDALGEEIMQLVSKILTQRSSSFRSSSSTTSSDIKQSKSTDVDDKNDLGVKKEESEPKINDDDGHKTSQDEQDDRLEHSKIHNRSESFSVCTVVSDGINDDRSYSSSVDIKDIQASSNSLLDGTYSKGRRSKDDDDKDDDDSSTLEIIYEYFTDYSEESEEECSTASSYVSRRERRYSSHSVAPSTTRYHADGGGGSYNTSYSNASTRYSRNSENNAEENYNFSDENSEDIEYPPRGYHRYSPSSSRYSPSSSSRHSSLGASSHYKRSQHHDDSDKSTSVKSHCSSYSSTEVAAVEEEEEEEEEILTVPGRINDGISAASLKTDDRHSQDDEYSSRLKAQEENGENEEELVNAIESHLDSTVLMTSTLALHFNNPSSFTSHASASVSTASSSADDDDDHNLSRPSISSGSSTKERKGICITVVSRASRYTSFPSSMAHTYMTFFRANLLKSQVDDVLEEQFQETREGLLETSCTTNHHTNCSAGPKGQKKKKPKRKYQGEYNEEGERHGYGIYTSKNGNEYRGEWVNDNREGLGVVKVGQGDVYEGQFESNLKNGIGVYHYKDGECDLSRYKDDIRIGDTLRYSKDRGTAFLLSDDSSGSKTISLEEATQVAKEMGTVVACC